MSNDGNVILKNPCYCLLLVLFLSDCTKGPSHVTRIIIPDSLQQSLEQNGTMIKYMTDEGIPVVEPVTKHRSEIDISANRKYINVALQNNEQLTRHFVLRNGEAVKLVFGNDGSLAIKGDNAENSVLPYDENYSSLRDSVLFNGNQHSFDAFIKYWHTLEISRLTTSIDDVILNDLKALQKKSIHDFVREQQFLDSLESNRIMSPYIIEFYRLLVTFDSIKVLSYPQLSLNSLVAPYEAITIAKPKLFNETQHLVFYDDWVNMHYRVMFTKSLVLPRTVSNFDSLYDVISLTNIQDRTIKVQMLLHHVVHACENSTPENCRQAIARFENDPKVDKALAEKVSSMSE